jgi:branched-chain amino acid transport system permease protein
MVVVSIFSNWSSLTNGPLGIRDIPQPKLLGHLVTSRPEFAIIAVVIAFCAYKIVSLFITGAFGRVLHAVREDEAFAWSLGKNTFRPKLIAIAVSAMLAACSGSLYAYYLSYIDPSSFTITESILVFSMIIIGGAGTRWGSMIGAAFLVLTLEVLEWVGIPSTLAVNIRQLIYAFLLIGVLIRNPQGFGIPPPFSRRSGRA